MRRESCDFVKLHNISLYARLRLGKRKNHMCMWGGVIRSFSRQVKGKGVFASLEFACLNESVNFLTPDTLHQAKYSDESKNYAPEFYSFRSKKKRPFLVS